MKSRHHKKTYTFFAVIMIALIYTQIYRFSDMPADLSEIQSTSVTERILDILERLFQTDLPYNNSSEQFDRFEGLVRKIAHFSEFALLGLLTYSIAICWNKNNKKGTACSFLFVVILAAADEFHQYFVPGRACSLRDIGIDSAGCAAGMLLLKILYGKHIRKHLKAGRND